jgi:S-DNA-T family DNA segregation ATPase FtsK/SpoIIIE
MAYSLSDYPPLESRLRDFAARHALRATGLAVLVLSAAFFASLMTWHVDDPSFSYVTDGPVQNILGWPGAAFADLAMQFFGFAVVGLVFPLAIFGWNLFRLCLPRHPVRQVFAWLGGAMLFAAALSCLPVLQQWPLPTGLGGALGDLILSVPEWFGGGSLSPGLYAALFVILSGLSIGLLWTACLRRPSEVGASARRQTYVEEQDHEDYDAADDEPEEENASDGRLRLLAGFAAHWALTAKAAAFRLVRRAAQARRERKAETEIFRREPSFLSDGADAYEEYEEDEFDDAFADAVAEHHDRQPAPRKTVQPAAPRPKPSTRARKEAQPSLLPTEEFELPPLNLLSEPPPQKRSQKIDSTALEQNARLLEGVLDDFGVRGEIINIRPGPVVTLYELEPAPGIKSPAP